MASRQSKMGKGGRQDAQAPPAPAGLDGASVIFGPEVRPTGTPWTRPPPSTSNPPTVS